MVLQTLFVGAFQPQMFWHENGPLVGVDCSGQDSKESVLWTGEIIFTLVFLVEMIIKIIARGFFMHKHAYLRDALNWLDFIVVLSGTISLLMDVASIPPSSISQVSPLFSRLQQRSLLFLVAWIFHPDPRWSQSVSDPYSARSLRVLCAFSLLVFLLFSQVLRVLRILRPLRTMTRLPGMKPLMKTLVKAIGALTNVVLLLIFGFILFGIFGMDIQKAGLRGRCYFDPTKNQFSENTYSRLISQQTPFLVEASSSAICAPSGWVLSEGNPLGGMGCQDYAVDGVVYNVTCSRQKWCQHQLSITDPTKWGEWCRFDYNDNPFDLGAGWLSYDNFLGAFLCIWQTLTNEGWVDLMYSIGDGVSVWGSRAFHFTWVVLGSMIIIQLVLGSLSISYTQARDEEEHARDREALSVEAILMESDRNEFTSNPDACKRGLTGMSSISGLLREPNGNVRRLKGKVDGEMAQLEKVFMGTWANFRHYNSVMVRWPYFQHFITAAIVVNTLNMMIFTWHDQPFYEGMLCKRRCELDPHLSASASADCNGPLFNHTYESNGHRGGERRRQEFFCSLKNDAHHKYPAGSKFQGASCSKYQNLDDCILPRPGIPGMGCWWKDDTCQLGLFSVTEFGVIDASVGSSTVSTGGVVTLPSKISLRHLCGESVGDFEALCPAYDPNWTNVSSIINLILTWIFLLEMVTKLLGYGPVEYFADTFNRLDFCIVMASVLEMANIVAADVSVFRTLRLTRLLKLMRSMTEVQNTLRGLIIALGSMYPLMIVLVIFIFMASALMISLFANTFRFVKSDWPRSNFDSFFMSERGHGAFTTIFQMLTTENWNTIMYNCIRTSDWDGQEWGHAMMAMPSVLIVLIGNYIFINLFISILLEGFEEDAENQEDAKNMKKLTRKSSKILSLVRQLTGPTSAKIKPQHSQRIIDTNFQAGVEGMGHFDEPEDDNRVAVKGYLGKHQTLKYPGNKSFFVVSANNPIRIFMGSICQHPVFDWMILLCILITTLLLLFENPVWSVVQQDCPRPPNALDCSGLSPGHQVMNCETEKTHPYFGRVWKACDDPNPGDHPPCCRDVYNYETFSFMDRFFSLVFLVEMILKMVTDGLILHEHSYLRNSWNLLDCLISILGMLSAFGEGNTFKSFKVLRVVRALRPLRVIRRHPNLRVAVLGLIASVPAIINVMPLLFFWYVIYAMLGVSIFKGMMYSCYNPNDQSFTGVAYSQGGPLWEPSMSLAGPNAVPTIVECVAAGDGDAVWKQKPYSFNNIFTGGLTLWEMGTTEGWMDVMAALIDSPGSFPGVTPLPNMNPVWPTIFCMCHIFFGSFIFMNVIVSKVINNYMKVKNENNGTSMFITKEQKEWKSTRLMIMKLKPRQRSEGPENQFRKYMFDLCQHAYFDLFITICIGLNIFCMMINSLEYEAIECFTATMFWVNVVFTIVFWCEMIVKMIGLGLRWYFLDSWNILDFVVVIFSVIILAMDIQTQEYRCGDKSNSDFSVLRVFRVRVSPHTKVFHPICTSLICLHTHTHTHIYPGTSTTTARCTARISSTRQSSSSPTAATLSTAACSQRIPTLSTASSPSLPRSTTARPSRAATLPRRRPTTLLSRRSTRQRR